MDHLLKHFIRFRKIGLIYFCHGVTKRKSDIFIENLHLDFRTFKNGIELFEKLGFEFISMPELLNLSKQQFKTRRPWIHLTFDDGYENNLSVISPYLKEKKIPWSLFVSTHHIENQERFYTYKIRCAVLNTKREINLGTKDLSLSPQSLRKIRINFADKANAFLKTLGKMETVVFMQKIDSLLDAESWRYYNQLYKADNVLSPKQLIELADNQRVHIGSHNHRHIILNKNVSSKEIYTEMKTSKNWLQQQLKRNITSYCYPNGKATDFSPVTRRICKSLDYKLGFTTIDQAVSATTDPYEIPRISFPVDLNYARRHILNFLIPGLIKKCVRKLFQLSRTLSVSEM